MKNRSLVRMGLSLLVSLAAIAGPGSVERAAAVQASGSLLVVPSNWASLAKDDVIDVQILARNSSTDTPAVSVPDGTGDVSATLTGPIEVQLACADPTCSTQVAGKMEFVPGGAAGCVSKDAAVSSCAANGGNAVTIALSGPITIPPGGTVPVATIRVKIVDATGVGQLGISAHTEPASLTACSTNEPSVCAMCMADGCTKVTFVQGVNVGNCPHACVNRIRFVGDAATPDTFEFHGIVVPAGVFDPVNQPFHVELSNALFQPIFSFTLPPGSFHEQSSTFTFADPDAATNGGVVFVRVAERDGLPGAFKFDIRVSDASLQARATVPDMTFDFGFGGETFTVSAPWTPTVYGWMLTRLP